MPVLLSRVDDRLIHGQVVVGWAQNLKANHIVVINDDIIRNDMQKFLFRMATPSDIKLSILSVKEASEQLKKREFDEDSVILLFRSPADVCGLLENGGRIGEINIGGMHYGENKVQLFDAIFVGEEDVRNLLNIKELGVSMEVRMVPSDSKKDIIKAIDEKYFKKGKK